jgi:hypothetical protein
MQREQLIGMYELYLLQLWEIEVSINEVAIVARPNWVVGFLIARLESALPTLRAAQPNFHQHLHQINKYAWISVLCVKAVMEPAPSQSLGLRDWPHIPASMFD